MTSRNIQTWQNYLFQGERQRKRQEYCSILQFPVQILKNIEVDRKALLKKKHAEQMRTISLSKQTSQRCKQKRIQINTAYEALSQFLSPINYSHQERQLLNILLQQDTQKLKQILISNPQLINYRFQISKRSLIYLAVKTGCFETVELILKMGCSIDFRIDTNTPMHCAVYYGHCQIIGLLLEYGVQINIKNKLNRLPIQQFPSDQIRHLLQDAQKDKFHKLITELIQQNIFHSVINFYNNETIIAKRIVLNSSKQDYDEFEDAFHGTSFDNLKSITKHGLRVPGQVVEGVQIKIVDGHTTENMKWAKAVFVSPSLLYSADSSYSKSITNTTNKKTQTWLPIVQVKVKKGCYQTKQSTISSYKYKDDQPSKVQYRIQMYTDECRKKVTVVALLLIKKKYIESVKNYKEVVDMFLKKSQ